MFFFIGDGIGDLPLNELNDKTPLEYANTPAMDTISQRGANGLFLPYSYGTLPKGASVIMSFLGLDPLKIRRGALEAIGAGIELSPGDVALLGRFAHLDEQGRLVEIAEWDVEEGPALAAELDEYHPVSVPGVSIRVKYTAGNKVSIVIKGEGLSPNVSDLKSSPGLPIEKARPLDGRPETIKTMKIVNECGAAFSEILNESYLNEQRIAKGKKPINFVTMEAAGTTPEIESVSRLYDVTSAIVCGDRSIRGTFCVAGFEMIDVENATGTIKTNTEAKIKKALESNAELVVVHYKAPLLATMEGNYELKVRTIETFDSIIETIMDKIGTDNAAFAVLVQRNASVKLRKHLGFPTPFAIMSPYIARDHVKKFSEKEAAKGYLHILKGTELFHVILYGMGRFTEHK